MDKGTKIIIGVLVGTGVGLGLVILFRKKMPPLTTKSLQNARQLGLDLGTAYPFYDPLSWTENDQHAEDLIASIPASQIPQLEADYKKIFQRDLAADLQEKLDGWNNVSYKFIHSAITPGIDKAVRKIRIKRAS